MLPYPILTGLKNEYIATKRVLGNRQDLYIASYQLFRNEGGIFTDVSRSLAVLDFLHNGKTDFTDSHVEQFTIRCPFGCIHILDDGSSNTALHIIEDNERLAEG